ncbi:hypothetical protein DFS34DRAFT_620121 [Phlyctochytrium arcticum]|nr:hypothetical protein DFS34DRAFT_620121 [Phlyctochytrium arcticum]
MTDVLPLPTMPEGAGSGPPPSAASVTAPTTATPAMAETAPPSAAVAEVKRSNPDLTKQPNSAAAPPPTGPASAAPPPAAAPPPPIDTKPGLFEASGMAPPPDSLSGATKAQVISNQRRVIAEDPEWNLAAVENLSELCLKSIVANFEKRPVLQGIPTKYREHVLSAISVEMPLQITAPLIPDDIYWKRKATATFKLCDPAAHGNVWKRLFFEKHMRQVIERYIPGLIKLEDLVTELDLAAPYVQTLKLNQLLPEGYPPSALVSADEKKLDHTKKTVKEPTSVGLDKANTDMTSKDLLRANGPPDHLDIGLILSKLAKVSQISLYYGVRDCGINFDWQYFGMTLNDCISLSNALKSSSNLTELTIQASQINDDQCRLLASALLPNTTLKSLDISHNRIGDDGARGLAKLLSNKVTTLTSLNLTNNKIARHGAKCLGAALTQNSALTHLALSMNFVTDAGGASLVQDLKQNTTLQRLQLSSNGLGIASVNAVCDLLKHNGRALVFLDLSCNKLGKTVVGKAPESSTASESKFDTDAAGKLLLEAVSQNKYVTTLDLRSTQISEEYTVAIQGIVQENKGTG